MLNPQLKAELEKLAHRQITEFRAIPSQDMAHLGELILNDPEIPDSTHWQLLAFGCGRLAADKSGRLVMSCLREGDDAFMGYLKIEVALQFRDEIQAQLNSFATVH